VVIKARVKTVPVKQWLVGREMNRRIKKRFDKGEIQIPFPTQTINFAGELPTRLRDELKQVVREVLAEGGPQVRSENRL
jgi:small-conductance mechanosensitive channel